MSAAAATATVTPMRPTSLPRVVALAVVAAWALAIAAPAVAHPSAVRAVVDVGSPATVTIVVPSEEQSPMTGVELRFPSSYRFGRAAVGNGWTSATTPAGRLKLSGPAVQVGASLTFTV